uniref:Uncharacterized protein n=1 Tax=Desulfovibrio sp. U5L TaxID=596152 RepID=I2Q5E5_9BACT
MYEDGDVISVDMLCDILKNDPLYSRGEIVDEIIGKNLICIEYLKIENFFKNYSAQEKLAILIAKEFTFKKIYWYMPSAWTVFDNTDSLEAQKYECETFWNEIFETEVEVLIVQGFFLMRFLPRPAALWPKDSANSNNVWQALIGDIPTGVKRSLSLEMVRSAIKKILTTPAPVAEVQNVPEIAQKDTKTPLPSKKEQDRQDALAVAARYWENNPELRPIEIARAILEKKEASWRCKAPALQTLRNWIAPHAPDSARKTGRPRRIPR